MEVFHIENPKAWIKHTDTSDIYIYIKYILMNVEHHIYIKYILMNVEHHIYIKYILMIVEHHIYIKYILMIVEQLHLHKIHIDECGCNLKQIQQTLVIV